MPSIILTSCSWNPSSAEKNHLMASALAKNDTTVMLLNLCHETQQSTAYKNRFYKWMNYRVDFGIKGRLFDGRTKIAKLINNLRISLDFSIRLIKFCLGFKPDCLILSRGALEMTLPTVVICHAFGIRIIGSIMEYGPSLAGYRYINSKLEWFLITRFSHAFFLISNFLVEALGGQKKSMYLPVLIDINLPLDYYHDEKLQMKSGLQVLFEFRKPILLYTGSKGYKSLLLFCLKALSRVPEDYCVAITGRYSEQERESLNVFTEKLGIRNKVFFTGYLSDGELDVLENKSQALLMPLLPEVQHEARFPQKLLHYMFKKKPVITTDVGEISSFFHNRDTAYVCSPVTPEHYADTISAVLQDPIEAAGVADRGCRFVRKHFDHTLWGAKMLAFIDSVVDKQAYRNVL